ncbi:MAG TPA: single-stranded DNA-binding protein [Patescibacteria group bacterium]|nr:single-stranded DNA-binding protein [Patescibacteria group bacterium]
MAGRSLNKVQLIGNLTRDPELRYTPSGAAVCTFGLATNRTWTTDSGEKREEVDFHNIVAWRKLAELCSQFLVKGRKVYVEGRLTTRSWTGQDGQQKSRTEVVIDDMILLDNKGSFQQAPVSQEVDEEESVASSEEPKETKIAKKKTGKEKNDEEPVRERASEEEVMPDDIPF